MYLEDYFLRYCLSVASSNRNYYRVSPSLTIYYGVTLHCLQESKCSSWSLLRRMRFSQKALKHSIKLWCVWLLLLAPYFAAVLIWRLYVAISCMMSLETSFSLSGCFSFTVRSWLGIRFGLFNFFCLYRLSNQIGLALEYEHVDNVKLSWDLKNRMLSNSMTE